MPGEHFNLSLAILYFYGKYWFKYKTECRFWWSGVGLAREKEKNHEDIDLAEPIKDRDRCVEAQAGSTEDNLWLMFFFLKGLGTHLSQT